MRSRPVARSARVALAAAATLLALTTACGPEDDNAADRSDDASPTQSQGTDQGEDVEASTGGNGGAEDTSGSDTAGSDGTGSGSDTSTAGSDSTNDDMLDRRPVCGAEDITLSASLESQAGSHILITARAKPGFVCKLPGEYPVVAFGSDGTEAAPAEQAVGEEIEMVEGATAYAGVTAKTTGGITGVEFEDVIVAVDQQDPAPVSLAVGRYVVDKPIVTNWHTSMADALPDNG